MANTFKLDDLIASANEEYANTEIEFGDGKTVVLVNALQLPEGKREELSKSQDAPEGEEQSSQLERLRNTLRIVANGDENIEGLLSAIGDNLAYLVKLLETYNKGTQVGEA